MGSPDLASFMNGLIRRNPGEPEFHQAVEEVVNSLMPFLRDHPRYTDAGILERMTEPDRVIMFRVCWLDDDNQIRTSRAYRVQFNNSIGPYKGGLRFQHDYAIRLRIRRGSTADDPYDPESWCPPFPFPDRRPRPAGDFAGP